MEKLFFQNLKPSPNINGILALWVKEESLSHFTDGWNLKQGDKFSQWQIEDWNRFLSLLVCALIQCVPSIDIALILHSNINLLL